MFWSEQLASLREIAPLRPGRKKKTSAADNTGKKKVKRTQLVYRPERRRCSFDLHLRHHSAERNAAIAALVKAGYCDFDGICNLILCNVQVTTRKAEITFLNENIACIEDPGLLDTVTRYLTIRSASDFKHLMNKDSFFFVSADGGSLVVDTDNNGKRPRDIAQVLHAENFLITHLLTSEDISFNEVREASIEDLLERGHSHEVTRDAIKFYAQVMRVLPLG